MKRDSDHTDRLVVDGTVGHCQGGAQPELGGGRRLALRLQFLCVGEFLQQRVEELRVAVVVEANLCAGHGGGVQAVAGGGMSWVEALEVLYVRDGFLGAVKERGELTGGEVGVASGGEGALHGPLVGVHGRLP